MKGMLHKRIASAQLQCAKCRHFRDDEYQYRRLDHPVLNEDHGALDHETTY